MHLITTLFFFYGQDVPALLIVGMVAAFVVVGLRRSGRSVTLALPFAGPANDACDYRRIMLICAAAAGIVSLLIGVVVLRSFPLSIDEKMVFYDAGIFSRGVLAAPVPEMFRDMIGVFERLFVKATPDHSLHHSMYLPLNALLHLPFIALGLPTLIDALMVAGTVVVTYDIIRKLLPTQPDAALFGAVLLASSPQILMTGATVYAMTAHLFLDMLWLRLMMSDRRAAWVLAVLLGFIASGLHQWAYFPFFVVGFVWEWWRGRDYQRLFAAVLPALVGVLVWSRYRHFSLPDFWSAAMPTQGDQTLMAQARAFGSALAPSIALVLEHLTAPAEHEHQATLMPYNLFRFVIWQNPALWFAVVAGYPLWKRVALVRAIMVSMLAMGLVVTLFVPFQGHGWGYRYLHHFLGGLSLCAAFGYQRLAQTRPDWPARLVDLARSVRLWCVVSLLAVLPYLAAVSGFYNWHYWQIDRELSAIKADFILVDTIDMPYAFNFIVNDPFYLKRPLRMLIPALELPMLDRICAMGTVHLYRAKTPFDSSDDQRKAELPEAIKVMLDPQAWRQKGCRLVDAGGQPLP